MLKTDFWLWIWDPRFIPSVAWEALFDYVDNFRTSSVSILANNLESDIFTSHPFMSSMFKYVDRFKNDKSTIPAIDIMLKTKEFSLDVIHPELQNLIRSFSWNAFSIHHIDPNNEIEKDLEYSTNINYIEEIQNSRVPFLKSKTSQKEVKSLSTREINPPQVIKVSDVTSWISWGSINWDWFDDPNNSSLANKSIDNWGYYGEIDYGNIHKPIQRAYLIWLMKEQSTQVNI